MKCVKRAAAVFLCVAIIIAVLPALSVFADNITVLIEEYVNIRNLPTTEGSSVLFCTPSYVTAVSDGYEYDTSGRKWYHVTLDNGISGYTCGDYVTERPDLSGENDADKMYPSLFEDGRHIVMVTDSVNVRQSPTTSSTSIAYLWPCVLETIGTVTGTDGKKWYSVITPGGLNGYIRGDFIAEYTYTPDADFENTLLQFPVSYRKGLRYLHTLYPNWKFYADSLPITLEYAVNMEAGRKLISNSYTSLPESWRTGSGIAGLEPGYRHASKLAISYFMNPENFITPTGIFTFMLQGYDPATQNAASVKKIVSGTFLDSDEYIGYFLEAAAASNVNPDVLAGTVLQEQGRNGGALCSGEYPGYEGYYNFFNFSASGASQQEIITNGLEYAKKQGWDSPRASITGGAVLYGENYLCEDQNTYYYKNYNVKKQIWYHQYATNVSDHLSNAAQIADVYAAHDSYASFSIPVFAGSNFDEHTHVWGELQHNAAHHFYKCTLCGKIKDEQAHTFTAWANTASAGGNAFKQERHCTVCGRSEIRVISASGKVIDLNGDGAVTDADAVYLLFYTFFPADYPISGSCDYNGDGTVNDADAVYLLFYTFFPFDYPIY